MNSEESRYLTFANWPANSIVDAKRVAKAGFYYLGHDLEVKCFACGKTISEWNYGDKAMNKHASLNPSCPFVNNPAGCGNIPIESTQSSRELSNRSSTELDSVIINPRTSLLGSAIQLSRPPIIDYQQSEAARLESFTNWPKAYIVTPESLARAGFFYIHQSDKVQCAFCDGIVSHWEAGDIPEEEHERHFPHCRFIQMLRSNGVAYDHFDYYDDEDDSEEDEDDDEEEEVETENEDGGERRATGDVTEPTAVSERRRRSPEGVELRFPSSSGQDSESAMRELGVQSHKIPKHPKYSMYEARLQTFVNWPADVSQTPEDISEAGFFYAGSGDQVRCFHCDGGLRMWDPSDEPWLEHARWFPHCQFILLVKGQPFVDEAILLRPPLDESQIKEQLGRVSKPNADYSVAPAPAQRRTRLPVSESQLQELISSPIATSALQLGLEFSRVKTALRQRAASGAPPFETAQALINAVLDVQLEEDDHRETWLTPPNTPIPPQFGSSNQRGNSRTNFAESASTEEDTEADDEADTPRATPSTVTASATTSSLEKEREKQTNDRKAESETETAASSTRCLSPSPGSRASSAAEEETRRSVQYLEEEVRRLREARLCKICMDTETCVVLLPCGHLVTCVQCAHSLADCPVCRKPIKATVRTFLA
ncbi:death-associated inhibitor of apoptosis 2 [Nilaparvata lugens]|uniref:death-associated inhibitor of apoptosis 2 n=1 Tax=Nilaparvata lugens TaxID=108931 RepID=UPI00193D02E0|nr:death-associated inhibitor of apoptosis 2 [Nilaparvata lugens]